VCHVGKQTDANRQIDLSRCDTRPHFPWNTTWSPSIEILPGDRSREAQPSSVHGQEKVRESVCEYGFFYGRVGGR